MTTAFYGGLSPKLPPEDAVACEKSNTDGPSMGEGKVIQTIM